MECEGDIHAVLKAFRTTGDAPAAEGLKRRTTAVVLSGTKGAQVMEFPRASLEVLRGVQMGRSTGEMAADFGRRGIGVPGFTAPQVVGAAIELLLRKKLIQSAQAN